MHTFYIDVPSNYNYNWSLAPGSSKALQLETGALKVFFVANSIAKISNGDCYQVTVPTTEDELFYILKTGFTQPNSKAVDDYLANITT